MTDLFSELDEDQQLLLRSIYVGFQDTGKWPNWGRVRKWLRRRRPDIDPEEVLASLPTVGNLSTGHPSYSSVWYQPSAYGDDREIRLTIAASLHLIDYQRTTDVLVRIIRYFGILVDHADIDKPAEKVSRNLAANDLRLDPDTMLSAPFFLSYEPFGLVSLLSQPSDENWEVELRDILFEYRDAANIEAYVSKVTELILKKSPQPPIPLAQIEVQPLVSNPASTYIAAEFVDRLNKVDATTWRVEKLIALIGELNYAVESELPYASIMLCRAVMDHIPPFFGKKTFGEVANQVQMLAMDKAHLKKLDEGRSIANDALHRQGGKDHQPIDMSDVPRPAHMNALLRLTVAVVESSQP